MTTRSLQVSYGQLGIFLSSLDQPFNDWTEGHVRQGFAWRQGSVSFATLETAGDIELAISFVTAPQEPLEASSRAILVPFEAGESQSIVIASILGKEFAVTLKHAIHALVFEHGSREGTMWARVSLCGAPSSTEPRILKADAALKPDERLLMQAEPAAP